MDGLDFINNYVCCSGSCILLYLSLFGDKYVRNTFGAITSEGWVKLDNSYFELMGATVVTLGIIANQVVQIHRTIKSGNKLNKEKTAINIVFLTVLRIVFWGVKIHNWGNRLFELQ